MMSDGVTAGLGVWTGAGGGGGGAWERSMDEKGRRSSSEDEIWVGLAGRSRSRRSFLSTTFGLATGRVVDVTTVGGGMSFEDRSLAAELGAFTGTPAAGIG